MCLSIARLKRLVDGLMHFSPSGARRESFRWQIIWWADIFPQRGSLFGPTLSIRSRSSFRSRVFCKVRISMGRHFTTGGALPMTPRKQQMPPSLAWAVN